MNRRLTFLMAALEATIIAAIGVFISLAPLTIVWLFENDPSITWLVPYRAATDIWLLAQGSHLSVPAATVLSFESPAFSIGILPLGLSVIIAAMAFRLGRRLTAASQLWPGWSAAVIAYGLMSLLITTSSYDVAIFPVAWEGTFFPPAFFTLFMVLGSVVGRLEYSGDGPLVEPAERLWIRQYAAYRFDRFNWAVRALFSPALRAGTGVTAIMLAASSILIALLIGFNWVQFTRLYEGLHVSFLGGVMITLGQLAFLPNVVIFGASWLTGVGFSVGTGSTISPLGTVVGPLPALPITAALPVGANDFGMVAILVPLVAAFVATILVRKHAAEIRFEFASPLSAAISLGISVGLVAAIEMGILAALASGSVGPGRLVTVGINPWMLALVTFIEVALVSTLAAFYSARPDAPDHPLLSRKHKVN